MTSMAISQDDRLIPQILSALKDRKGRQAPVLEAADYDWKSPHMYTSLQRRKLQQFLSEAASSVGQSLAHSLHEMKPLKAGVIRQCYPSELAAIFSNGYHSVPIQTVNGQRCGLVLVDASQAMSWVAQILGASSSVAQDRPLSSLEQTLLGDVLTEVVEAFSSEMVAAGAPAVRLIKDISPSASPSAEGWDVAVVLPMIDPESETPVVQLVLEMGTLNGIVGINTMASEEDPRLLRGRMQDHIGKVMVTGHVLLGTSRLTMREMMNLEAGDVVLLPLKVTQPLEFRINDKKIFSGKSVSCQGRHALQVINDSLLQ